MSFLDPIVARYFRDQEVGRVVVFPGERGNRGYLVRSEAEEAKIRSFLKMFEFGQLAVTFLGGQVALAWSIFFTTLHSLGNPAQHVFRTMTIYVVVFCLVEGFPFLLLWSSYKNATSSFASGLEEVRLSSAASGRRPWNAIAALIVLAALIFLGVILFLARAK